MQTGTSSNALLLEVNGIVCGLPVAAVTEVLPVLSVSALRGMPSAMVGLAIHRGGPVPVLSLARLVAGGADDDWARVTRLVAVRSREGSYLLGVERLIGIRSAAGLEQGLFEGRLYLGLNPDDFAREARWDARSLRGAA